MCVQIAGAVFSLDESGQSIVQDPAAADTDTIVDAASQCPMEAITIVDAGSGETLFP